MEPKTGWRTTPAPILTAFAVWILYTLARVVVMATATLTETLARRLQLTSEGIYFACMILLLVGLVELRGRTAGSQRSVLSVAIYGAALALVLDIVIGLTAFMKHPYDHRWIFDAYQYGATISLLAVAVGMTLAVAPERRAIGFAAIAMTALAFLPPPLADKLWPALGVTGKSGYYVHALINCARLALLAVTATLIVTPATTAQPAVAADGLRSAAKGLWIRVVAAMVVLMFTLVMIAGRSGGDGAMSFFKVIMLGQAVVAVVALLMTGLGALRAARAGIDDLQPYLLAIGGGASLWAAGVSLSQVPTVYKVFYGGGSGGGMSSRELREMADVLSLAVPIIVIIGVGLLATALSGFAARRNNEELRSDAQGKGIGYVALLLVSIAIHTWMVPKATSLSSFAMMSILAAVASLWGTVMMAKLFDRGATTLEYSEAGLPQATVVSDSSST